MFLFMMNRYILLTVMCLCIMLSACDQVHTPPETGMWRGVLKTEAGQEVPFLFELSDSNGRYQAVIMNAGERLLVDEITFRNDSVFMVMPFFDSEFRLKLQGNKMTGTWIRHLADKDVLMDFEAQHGNAYRFFPSPVATAQAGGRWEAMFISAKGDTTLAVAEFEQSGAIVTGTFLTTTGDYRYLEGVVQGNELFLSCFDGAHAFLFRATINNEQEITQGVFYSGLSYSEQWSARKNEQAILPDANRLTYLRSGYDKIDFSFPGLDKKMVSLSDEAYKNKVVIIQVLGSWCPNCLDETEYLVPFYEQKKDQGLEIIGLAYERSPDFEKAKGNITRMQKRLGVKYTLLVAGTNDKNKVNESLPMLNNFLAFPTTIIIDRKGNVRRIHTGFSGPATGVHFTEFKKEFELFIDSLLNEPSS